MKMPLGLNFSDDLLFFIFKKRDRAAIIADILKSVNCGKGKRKTNIMQSANLNFDQVNKYLDLLLRNGYVILADGYRYKPTSKGLRLVENLESDYLKIKIRV